MQALYAQTRVRQPPSNGLLTAAPQQPDKQTSSIPFSLLLACLCRVAVSSLSQCCVHNRPVCLLLSCSPQYPVPVLLGSACCSSVPEFPESLSQALGPLLLIPLTHAYLLVVQLKEVFVNATEIVAVTTQPYHGLLHAPPAICTAKAVQTESYFNLPSSSPFTSPPPLLHTAHCARDGDPVLTGTPIKTAHYLVCLPSRRS